MMGDTTVSFKGHGLALQSDAAQAVSDTAAGKLTQSFAGRGAHGVLTALPAPRTAVASLNALKVAPAVPHAKTQAAADHVLQQLTGLPHARADASHVLTASVQEALFGAQTPLADLQQLAQQPAMQKWNGYLDQLNQQLKDLSEQPATPARQQAIDSAVREMQVLVSKRQAAFGPSCLAALRKLVLASALAERAATPGASGSWRAADHAPAIIARLAQWGLQVTHVQPELRRLLEFLDAHAADYALR